MPWDWHAAGEVCEHENIWATALFHLPVGRKFYGDSQSWATKNGGDVLSCQGPNCLPLFGSLKHVEICFRDNDEVPEIF